MIRFFGTFFPILILITYSAFSVPLDPDQKVYQVGEKFKENFLQIDFPEKALVRTESRKRWRAVPLKDRPWMVVWRKLDRAGDEETGNKSLEAVFPEKAPEKFSSDEIEIWRWTKEDISGGNPLQIVFYLVRKRDQAYTIYIAYYKERQDLQTWFYDYTRYLNPNP